MSTFASLYVINVQDLDGLRISPSPDPEANFADQKFDSLWRYLDVHSSTPFEYGWSGECMLKSITFLKDQGIDITKSTFSVGNGRILFLLFDKKIKGKFLKKLDPQSLSIDKLDDWLIENSERIPREAIIEAVALIHQYLEQVTDSTVVLLYSDFLDSFVASVPAKKKSSKSAGGKKFNLTLTQFFCDACGDRYEKAELAAKRIEDPSPERTKLCGLIVEEGNLTGKQRRREWRSDTEGLCGNTATRCYVIKVA